MEVLDESPDLPGACHVDSRGGLVEEKDARAVHDAGRYGELPLHSLGIAAELPAARTGEAEGIQEPPGPGLPVRFSHAVECPAETEVIEAAQLRVEIAFVGNHSDKMLCSPGILKAVYAAYAECSRIGPGKPGEHVDGGRFPRTVGAEKTEKFPLMH